MIGESSLAFAGSTVHLTHSAHSSVGAVRTINEDSFLASAPVFFVADGMGGHAHGQDASRTVVRVFEEHIEPAALSTPERIMDAIHSSNDAVRDLHSVEDFGPAVSGTTLTGVALVDAGEGAGVCWMVFNIGDSRVYSFDGHKLTQVSVDHSVVQELVDAGVLRPEDIDDHPQRNVITRAIGTDEYADADVWLIPLASKQTFLICSDGLNTEVGPEKIARLLRSAADADHDAPPIAEVLVDAAVANGGRDNVTVIVLESTLSQ